MLWTPHDYQCHGIEYQLRRMFAGLLFDPGLGKTSVCLATFRALRRLGIARRMLVVAPAFVAATVWDAEADKWDQFSDVRVSRVIGTEKQRIEALAIGADVYVIGVEALPWLAKLMKRALRKEIRGDIRELHKFYGDLDSKEWRKCIQCGHADRKRDNLYGACACDGMKRKPIANPGKAKIAAKEKRLDAAIDVEDSRDWKTFFDVLIIDESTRFMTPDTTSFRSLKRIRYLIPRRYILTGTPAPNGLINLWSQVFILDGGERLGKTFGEFKERFFERGGFKDREWFPQDGAKEKIEELIADICLRLDAEDWLDLPELLFNDVWVDLPPKVQRAYDKFERDLFARVDTLDSIRDDAHRTGKIQTLSAGGRYLTCRQLANGGFYEGDPLDPDSRKARHVHNAKTDAVANLVNELNGKPILIFYEFRHDHARLVKCFGKCVSVNSDTKSKDLPAIVKQWNAGGIRILLVQSQAMSHGANMQSGPCRDVAFYGLTDNLDVFQQAYKRVYRQGIGGAVRVHRFLARGTVDEMIAPRVDKKASYQRSILDALNEYRKVRHSNNLPGDETMLVVPDDCDIYEWLEDRIENGKPITRAIKHKNCIDLVVAVFPENSEGSLLEDIGFTWCEDRQMWTRCKTCLGVGRVDCCEKLDCEKCEGLFTAWCTDCDAGLMQIALDNSEREHERIYGRADYRGD